MNISHISILITQNNQNIYSTYTTECIKNFIDEHFKPLSELIDCRRYSFPKQNVLKRSLQNIEYFAYNYMSMAILTTIFYLVTNIWFIFGLLFTVGFWSVGYVFRQKILDESLNDMCFNIKMTFFLFVNSLFLWTFYGSELAEYIGYIVTPIFFHSILFEPVNINGHQQLQNIQGNNISDVESQQQQQQGELGQSNAISMQYNNQISIQESSNQIIQTNKMNDEQAQALQHVAQVDESTNRSLQN